MPDFAESFKTWKEFVLFSLRNWRERPDVNSISSLKFLPVIQIQSVFYSFFDFQSNYWLYLAALLCIHAFFIILWSFSVAGSQQHKFQYSTFGLNVQNTQYTYLKVPYIYSAIVSPVNVT